MPILAVFNTKAPDPPALRDSEEYIKKGFETKCYSLTAIRYFTHFLISNCKTTAV